MAFLSINTTESKIIKRYFFFLILANATRQKCQYRVIVTGKNVFLKIADYKDPRSNHTPKTMQIHSVNNLLKDKHQ